MFRRISVTVAVISTLAGTIACAHASPTPMTAEQLARCAVVRDSMFATGFPPESLPPARRPIPVVQGLSRFVSPGQELYMEFLVRPDGSVDTGSVRVEGILDLVQGRIYVAQQVGLLRYLPAEVAGCPVWSRVWMRVTNLGLQRVGYP